MNTEIEILAENEVTEVAEVTETLGENERESTKVDGRHNNPGRGKKVRVITPINQPLYNGYKESFENSTSFNQYNVTIGAFVEWSGNNAVYNLYGKDIRSFLDGFAKTDSKVKSATIHLNSFYKWLGENGHKEKLQNSVKEWMIWG